MKVNRAPAGRWSGARHSTREAQTPAAAGRGMARCDGMLMHSRFQNREDSAAGAACGVWNTVESGDYSITEFVVAPQNLIGPRNPGISAHC